jgi:hypothetical protein
MKLSLRSVVAGASALAITGGALAATAISASAATPPPWEPDGNALGNLTFYDASGNVVTGGSNLNHLFAYAQGSSADSTGGTKAALYFANPQPGQNSALWPNAQDTGSVATTQPAAGVPAPINNADPVANTNTAGGANLGAFVAGQTANTVAGYANVWQVRIYTIAAGGGGSIGAGTYWESDVQINPSAGTWQQIFPAVATSTNTVLGASPNPALTTQSVTLTATESPATPGSVQFKDGGSNVGSPVAVNGGGVATLSQSFAAGSHNLTAVFTPTDTTNFAGSTGATTLQVNPPSTQTTTSLGVNQASPGSAGTDISLSSTIVEGPLAPAPGTPVQAGTVSFYDNGSSVALNPQPLPPNASGQVTFDISAGLSAGGHSIVAKFTPTNPANFQASQSAASPLFLTTPTTGPCSQPGSVCLDTQNIQTSVPVGTIIINTPYTPTNPLDLGPMALNAAGTEFNVTGGFKCITVTDTTAGSLPWTAQALATNLTDQNPPSGATVTTIDAQNVGLSGFTRPPLGTDNPTCSDTQSYTGTVATTDNPAAEPAVAPGTAGNLGLGGASSHTFATGSGGDGVTTLDGSLSINAPANTAAGTYTGTITFTVSD